MRLISGRVPAVTLMRMRRSFLVLLCATAVAGVSAQTTAPRTHRLEATPETVAYGYYWADAKPVLHIGGTADHQIEFSDQKEAIAAAMRANGTPAKGTECGPYCNLYESEPRASVMTVLHPGGHTYPRGTSRVIVIFFRKHNLTAPPH